MQISDLFLQRIQKKRDSVVQISVFSAEKKEKRKRGMRRHLQIEWGPFAIHTYMYAHF